MLFPLTVCFSVCSFYHKRKFTYLKMCLPFIICSNSQRVKHNHAHTLQSNRSNRFARQAAGMENVKLMVSFASSVYLCCWIKYLPYHPPSLYPSSFLIPCKHFHKLNQPQYNDRKMSKFSWPARLHISAIGGALWQTAKYAPVFAQAAFGLFCN